MTKFILAGIQPRAVSDEEAFVYFVETQRLITSYGGKIVDHVIQRREIHDKGLFLGQGKLQEIAHSIGENQADVVVLNGIIKPGHLYDIKEFFSQTDPQIEVWDRADLILHIFSQHAQTAEARLQIELAAMRHMGPRIYGMGIEMSRQGGGIGGRGIGETNTERMKRHWRDQIKQTEAKLTKLTTDRHRQLQRRKRAGLQTASIVGYTNAGKSSLFNLLTKKDKLAQDALFATLDSAVGKVYLPSIDQAILVSDTIGFIQDLPLELVEAFKSTLMESINADLLLHLIDASDPQMLTKIQTVQSILEQLGLQDKPQIFVFNKLDQDPIIKLEQLQHDYALYHPQGISVYNQQGLDQLLIQIGDSLLTNPQIS